LDCPGRGRATHSTSLARARYTRANPPCRLLVKFACLNQSEAGRMKAAIKNLTAINKRKLIGKTSTKVRKLLLN
jgi:predicted GIY-YIG superfamily endonuclease